MLAIMAVHTAIPSAGAEAAGSCRLRTPNALFCISGLTAALAWREFGDDGRRQALSYNAARLRLAGCVRAKPADWRDLRLRQFRRVREPFADGWVPVLLLEANGAVYYIAEAYVAGKCQPYLPP